ncbi:Transcription factor, putative isoform 1 [Hibiscus syriacus]|uniref:Transcription factor, putative isoform 1 n=1 Tax=Hibiscus syriacus TaxID=106335 RepID=A0A6A3CZF6_HIBSY|nr:Transcription factor, putative isoform 1 [Hibiscus syriacus]
MEVNGTVSDGETLRSQFLQLLRSRRNSQVPLIVEPANLVVYPLYQEVPPPTFSEAMESCPKANIENLKEPLKEENLYFYTEAGDQGKLPLLIVSMKESNIGSRPAVVFLHSTHECKEWLSPLLEAYASRRYVTIAVDSRYHGERATGLTTCKDVCSGIIMEKWGYDACNTPNPYSTRIRIRGVLIPHYGTNIIPRFWNCILKMVSITYSWYRYYQPSIDTFFTRMHAWLAAFADTRYAVAAPIIGVQGFRWAIENDKWEARVNSIKAVFEEARNDLGKNKIDKVVEKVMAQPETGHQMTPFMVKEASDWFDRFLK